MALFHDLDEVRSGDTDWMMKRYVTIDTELINNDQCEGLDARFKDLVEEYDLKLTTEALLVKDADTLELILTLKELAFKGNEEAKLWLTGKQGEEYNEHRKLNHLKTNSAKELGKEIYDTSPTEWWAKIWTNKNR